MGCGECLSEAVDRVLHAAALGRQLAGHLVECAPESCELVAAAHRHTLAELTARDRTGGVGELP
jgi:hypothetical protein